MNIPKIMNFYYGGTEFSFLRYMSIRSFSQFNPDWKINLYVPKFLTLEHTWNDTWCNVPINRANGFEAKWQNVFHLVRDIPNVSIIEFDFNTIGFSNGLSEVHKSDVIRIWLLALQGGVFSDTDILYFKPISGVFNDDTIASFCYRWGGVGGPAYHSIGLLAGAPSNHYYSILLRDLSKHLDTRIYQAIGSFYYGKMLNPDHNSFADPRYPGLYNIEIDVVYPIRVPSMIFKDKSDVTVPYLKDCTIGIHWYGGAADAMKYQELMNIDHWFEYDNIISYLIKKVL